MLARWRDVVGRLCAMSMCAEKTMRPCPRPHVRARAPCWLLLLLLLPAPRPASPPARCRPALAALTYRLDLPRPPGRRPACASCLLCVLCLESRSASRSRARSRSCSLASRFTSAVVVVVVSWALWWRSVAVAVVARTRVRGTRYAVRTCTCVRTCACATRHGGCVALLWLALCGGVGRGAGRRPAAPS